MLRALAAIIREKKERKREVKPCTSLPSNTGSSSLSLQFHCSSFSSHRTAPLVRAEGIPAAGEQNEPATLALMRPRSPGHEHRAGLHLPGRGCTSRAGAALRQPDVPLLGGPLAAHGSPLSLGQRPRRGPSGAQGCAGPGEAAPPEGAWPAGRRSGPRPRCRCRCRARPHSPPAGRSRHRSGPAPAPRPRHVGGAALAPGRAPGPISDGSSGHASQSNQSAAAAATTPRGKGSRTAAPQHVIAAGQSPAPAPPRPGSPRAAGGAGRWRRSLGERRSAGGERTERLPAPASPAQQPLVEPRKNQWREASRKLRSSCPSCPLSKLRFLPQNEMQRRGCV